ncbi:hypothetical protein JOM56_002613 [Amanita muscaria]
MTFSFDNPIGWLSMCAAFPAYAVVVQGLEVGTGWNLPSDTAHLPFALILSTFSFDNPMRWSFRVVATCIFRVQGFRTVGTRDSAFA